MQKSLPVIVLFILSFMLFSSISFAATWTSESATTNTNVGLPHFFDLDTNTYSANVGDVPNYDLAIYQTGGVCRVICHYAFNNPSNISDDNYYCISPIDGDQYQLSSIDPSYFDSVDYYESTSGTTTFYLYVRNYQKQSFSRVNVTITYAGGTCFPSIIKHLETSDMAVSFYTKIPNPPVFSNDLTFTWDSDVNASVGLLYVKYPDGSERLQPQDETGKVDHSLTLPSGAFGNVTGVYRFNITSCQGDYLSISTWTNCATCSETYNTVTNTSSGQTCIQSLTSPILPSFILPNGSTPAPPSSFNVSADIISVNASVRTLPIGYEVTLTTLVRNNGSTTWNFYLGQSIGKNSTATYCDRDCYIDCQMGNIDPVINYGTYQCDFLSTGNLAVGQTVILTRRFLFKDAFFDFGLYDMVTAIYYAAYAPTSYDRILEIDYFNLTDVPPTITNLRTIPNSNPVAGKDTVIFTWWTSNENTTTVLEIRNPDGSFKSKTTNSAPDSTVGVTSHYITKGGVAFKVGTYTYIATSCQVEYPFLCSTQNKTVTFVAPVITDGELPNLVNPIQQWLSELLGIPYDLVLAFLGVVITIAIGIVVGIKTKDGTITVAVMILLLFVFMIINWIPIWLLIIFVILAGFIVAKWGKQIYTG